MSEGGKKLLDRDCRVAKDAAKGSEGDLVVKWDRDGDALRVARVSKAYVTPFLADDHIAKLG
jgi:hypothetical protein